MGIKSWKSTFFKKLGYRRIESPHKLLSPFHAQQKLIRVNTSPIIFDVGASVGQTTSQYRKHFPQAEIFSFEPMDHSFSKLKTNFGHDPKTHCFSVAFSDNESEETFFVNKGAETSSLLKPTKESVQWSPVGVMETVRSLKVSTRTLDNFCRSQKIRNIDILKMDTQGAELKILKGAQNLLESNSIHLIYTEVLFVSLYEDQASFYDLGSMLNSYGYQLFDFFHPRYDSTGQIKWADALFVKKFGAGFG